mgnify:CR=1 FL=1
MAWRWRTISVVAGRVVIRHVVAADLCVRNDGGEIVARVAAPVLGDVPEIGAEISHHRLHHPRELLRRELLLIRAVSGSCGPNSS